MSHETFPGTPEFFEGEESYVGHYEMMVGRYDTYRAYCDGMTDGFRKTGIQDPLDYASAVIDPRTVFCRVDGEVFPLIAPINYEDRYAADRCREMTEREETMLLTLPLTCVARGDVRLENLYGGMEFPRDFAVVVEEIEQTGQTAAERELGHKKLAELFRGLGNVEAGEFVHEDLRDNPDHRTAWMGMYSFAFASAVATPENLPQHSSSKPSDVLERTWREYCAESDKPLTPEENTSGTFLFSPEQLRDRRDIVDGLWEIAKIGFGEKLGAYHPMSMAVTEEFFRNELMVDGVYTVVTYHEGKPVCFGSLSFGMDNDDWLDRNSQVLCGELEAANIKRQTVAHFYELISNGPAGMSFSPSVLNLFIEIAGRTGLDYKVFFESTNLSALYIPKIANRQVRNSDKVVLTEPVRPVGKLHYWYLRNISPSSNIPSTIQA